MPKRRSLLVTALTAAMPFSLMVLPMAASAQTAGAYLDGAEPWTESDCAGDVPIVVGSDAKAQSDIYSAVTLAGVLGTDCVVLAGPRDGAMPANHVARLEAAEANGYVLGGTAAVPAAKIAGRDMTRLGGVNRWVTAQIIGNQARSLTGGTESDTAGTPDTTLTAPADVDQPGVFLDGAEPWIASDCVGDVPIVVGSDAKAQSDIYSAVTLAGVVGTDCVVLAGPRDGDMPASQQARLEAAAGGGFVLGGIAAVPAAKIAGRDMTRLGGATRWATAQLVGRRASGDTTAGTDTNDETAAPGEHETASGEGISVSAACVHSPDFTRFEFTQLADGTIRVYDWTDGPPEGFGGGVIKGGAHCTWSLRNNAAAAVRVWLQTVPDIANRVPDYLAGESTSSYSRTAMLSGGETGGFLLRPGASAALRQDFLFTSVLPEHLESNPDIPEESHYPNWVSDGRHVRLRCGYWEDTDAVSLLERQGLPLQPCAGLFGTGFHHYITATRS